MTDIYSRSGEKIAAVPLSEKQIAALEAGTEVTVLYHTPQLLQSLLGATSGSFTLRKDGDHIVTDVPDAVQKCASLQEAIRVARGES